MPTPTAVRIGRTYNLGNYESERIDVEVAVEGDFDEAVELARGLVEATRTPETTIAALRKLRAAGLNDDEIAALGVKLPKGAAR